MLAPFGFTSLERLFRKLFSRTAPGAGALALSLSAGVWTLDTLPVAGPDAAKTPKVASAPAVSQNPFGALLTDLKSRARSASVAPWRSASLESDVVEPVPPALSFSTAEPGQAAPKPEASIVEPGASAPLPPRRPPELGSLMSRNAARRAQQDNRTDLSTDAPDNRSVFEKFFGTGSSTPQAPGPALAYAAPENGAVNDGRNLAAVASPRNDQQTAIYDISAHTVYLPSGTKLEAHSGLGAMMDDPRYVHERMRGATPPHLYELSPREQLFHGVRALRLTPVGGGGVFGRAGLLAHTYMLGPNGQSNGCVSFRDYRAFLQAYENGEIKRLAVVPHLN
jgi:hypothetical protein